MIKKKEPPAEDLALFHEAMKGSVPLIQKKNRITKPAPAINRDRKKIPDEEPEEFFSDIDEKDFPEVRGEEFISYKQAAISHKTLRKLRKGQYNVEAILDLHGMNTEEAKIAVEQFLIQCLQRQVRVVLIIHGKGHHSQGPVLKNKLNHWLRATKSILAFCSAAPEHGSRGAIYVLLKN